jgi:hypothetical protein
MSKEEIIQFLKDNLTIHLEVEDYGSSNQVNIKLCLDGEEISSTFQYISKGE